MSFKKSKLVMLPTNQKALNLTQIVMFNNKLYSCYSSNYPYDEAVFQHLYILSDEEIKEGNWFVNLTSQRIYQNDMGLNLSNNYPNEQKIIATTDKSLIFKKDIIGGFETNIAFPQPSQSFIEKFVEEYNKCNIITEVMIEYVVMNKGYDKHKDYPYGECDILKINPKDNTITIKKVKDSWNREEVINLLYKHTEDMFKQKVNLNKWIEENL